MVEQNRRLAELLNIGPRTARRLIDLGIADEASLRRIGAVAAYRALKFADPKGTTLVALLALHGALTDTHWNRLPAETKTALRAEVASIDEEGARGQRS